MALRRMRGGRGACRALHARVRARRCGHGRLPEMRASKCFASHRVGRGAGRLIVLRRSITELAGSRSCLLPVRACAGLSVPLCLCFTDYLSLCETARGSGWTDSQMSVSAISPFGSNLRGNILLGKDEVLQAVSDSHAVSRR